MKKFTKQILVSAMVLSMCACGGDSSAGDAKTSTVESTENAGETVETTVEETEESSEEYDPMVDSIDFALENGAIKYVGIEKASEKLTDAENALIFKFEFTNYQAKPSQAQTVFAIKYYQNGAELSERASWSSNGGEQYTLINDFYSEALKDGTVTFGQIVVPKDSSPVTVMVRRNGGSGSDNDYQMMEVDIADLGSEKEAAADVSGEELQKALQGTWALSNGSFSFDNGNVTCLSAGNILSGTYEINRQESVIDAVFDSSDSKVTIHLPYTYTDGVMTVFNNRGEVLEKE